MMNHNLTASFLQEAEELLAEIESAALTLNSKQSNTEAVNHIFRGFHTIKGSGSMFGFDQVAQFTHHVETLLDKVRDGSIPVTDNLPSIILASADQIKALLEAAQGGPAPDPSLQAALLESVNQMTETIVPAEGEKPTGADILQAVESSAWNIKFRPEPTILTNGGNPVLLLRDLKKLGECTIEGHVEDIPALSDLDPEICYLWWTVDLSGTCTEADIRDVFLFAEDGSELVITPDNGKKLALVAPTTQDGVLVPTASSESSSGGEKATAATTQAMPGKEATVRVPAARLDRLVNLVGELVMNQSRLARAAAPFQSAELAGPVEEIDRLISELRDDVLQIRMMPIGSIFGRFRRLVHDLSIQLNKDIALVTEGEETELDKSILDQLGEPLVHMLRNSIDHGIESADRRLAAGKPQRGTIRLSAVHRGSDVVVTIEDDGGGLNCEAIRAKAIAKNLIAPDAVLSEKEIFNLILMPGFSTSQSITSISGRGVGMDVVKRQIDVLRGSLNISSKQGNGTAISLTLPLTLAIIDGLLIETADSKYIIPMASVTENVEFHASERTLNNGRNLIAVRGEIIPYIDLREIFRVPGIAPVVSKIVLVQHEGQRVGIMVDRVLGTYQTVIQPLGRFLQQIEVVSGSTIMGDGRVALILDTAAIVNLADGPVHGNSHDGGRIAA